MSARFFVAQRTRVNACVRNPIPIFESHIHSQTPRINRVIPINVNWGIFRATRLITAGYD